MIGHRPKCRGCMNGSEFTKYVIRRRGELLTCEKRGTIICRVKPTLMMKNLTNGRDHALIKYWALLRE
ncbi:MAG: hypothetical protein QW186_09960 [Candidatus Bathyarchaeia archaeon]